MEIDPPPRPYMTPNPNKPTGNELPVYNNLTNGNRVCSAHELMIKVLDKQDRKLDILDDKLDQLLQDKAVESTEKAKKDKDSEKRGRWLDIALGAGFTFICVLFIELIKFLTPL